jgi:ribosome-associated protein
MVTIGTTGSTAILRQNRVCVKDGRASDGRWCSVNLAIRLSQRAMSNTRGSRVRGGDGEGPMSEDLRADIWVSPRITVRADELEWTFARSSGPGGQNVNKVNSKAVLRWTAAQSQSVPVDVLSRFLRKFAARLTELGELVLASDEERDQQQNMRRCREKLQEMLEAVAIAPMPRRPTKPSAGSQRRRLADKKLQAEKKNRRQKPSRSAGDD